MADRRTLAVVCALAWASGCGGRAQPTLAGGKSVSHWVEELKSSDPKHRREAVEKLGNVGSADPSAFPAVRGALKDPDPRVRCEAVLAVLKFGERAAAEPALEEMRTGDPNPRARDYAARALVTIRSAR